MHFPFHPYLFNKMTCVIVDRIFEDRACMLLERLCHLAVLFVLLDGYMQLLWIFMLQTYPQHHHDLRRLYHVTLCWYEMSLFIKAYPPLLTETTIAVAQV